MSLVGFHARNHPQQANNPNVDDRAIRPEDFDPLNERFKFTVDAASSDENARLENHWTVDEDALNLDWTRDRVWCNPPYSNIEPWVAKAWQESIAGCELIVMLVPANRTEQGWWQREVEPYRRLNHRHFSVEFLSGRLRFLKPGQLETLPNERPPFGCCLLIWSKPR